MSGGARKLSLLQRLAYLRRRGLRYSWILLARKLGKRRMTLRVEGRRYRLTTDDAALDLMLNDEPWMIPLLRRVLPLAPGSFVDVGVNVGQTLLRLKSVEAKRNWIGLEPNPNCCKAVRRLLELNELEPASLIEKGLSDHSGQAKLHVDSDTDTRGTTMEKFHDNLADTMHEIEVELVDGRELVESEFVDKVGFVKIDVEGAESHVLDGLAPVIERDRPPVLLEILWIESPDPEIERVRETNQQRIFRFFKERDYLLRRVRGGARLEEFGELRKPMPLDMCNYLAFPREMQEKLEAS